MSNLRSNRLLRISSRNSLSQLIKDRRDSLFLSKHHGATQVIGAKSSPVSLDGAARDDTRGNGTDRALLGGRATALNGTSYFYLDNPDYSRIGSDNTSFTLVCNLISNGTDNANGYLLGSFEGAVAGAFLGFGASLVRFRVVNGSGTNVTVTGTTPSQIAAGEVIQVVGVFNQANQTIEIYVNGRLESTNGCIGFTAATSQRLSVGASSLLNNAIQGGAISFGGIMAGTALTAAQVRDLYKNVNPSQFENLFTYMPRCDGARCWDQVGGGQFTTGGTPTLYTSNEKFIDPWDLDRYGYSDSPPQFLNPGFDTDSDWSKGGNWKIENGEARTDVSGSFQPLLQNYPCQPVEYRLTLDCKEITGGYVRFMSRDDISDSSNQKTSGTITTIGTFTRTLTPESSNLAMGVQSNNVFTGAIDNIRVEYPDGFLVPRMIGSDLDCLGYPVNYRGRCPNKGQMQRTQCVTLNGTAYGVAPNTLDYSGEDWTLSGIYTPGDIGFDIRDILSQSGGEPWLRIFSKGWRSNIGAGASDFTDIADVVEGKDYRFSLTHIANDQSISLTVENLTDGVTQSQTITGKNMESQTGAFNFGANEGDTPTQIGKFVGFELVCHTDPNKSRKWNIQDNNVKLSRDSYNRGDIAWTNATIGTQDRFFSNRAEGCSKVVAFQNDIELTRSGNIQLDGKRLVELEADFHYRSNAASQTIYCHSFVSPFHVQCNSGNFRVYVRDSSNVSIVHTFTGLVGQNDKLYRFRVVIQEDETNPTTASRITVYDNQTGEQLGQLTGLDIAMSSASANSGNPQIGTYANATQPFNSNALYRVKLTIDGVEQFELNLPSINDGQGGDWSYNGGNPVYKYFPRDETNQSLDVNGYPLVNPPNGKMWDFGDYLDRNPVATNQYPNYAFYGASFNGSSSYIDLAKAFEWVNPFSMEVNFNPSALSGNFYVIGSSVDSSYKLQSRGGSSGQAGMQIDGGTFVESVELFEVGTTKKVLATFEGGETGEMFVQVNNGAGGTGPNDGGLPTDDNLLRFMANNTLSGFNNGFLQTAIINSNNSPHFDSPLASDSIDYSANCNHGTDTDMTYLKSDVTIPISDQADAPPILNGGFDDNSAWILGNGWSIANGKAVHTPNAGGSVMQSYPLKAGIAYTITYEMSDYVTGQVRVLMADNPDGSGNEVLANPNTSNGLKTVELTPNATNAYVGFDATTALDAKVDNFSIKYKDPITGGVVSVDIGDTFTENLIYFTEGAGQK